MGTLYKFLSLVSYDHTHHLNYALVGGAPEAYSSRVCLAVCLCVCYSAVHFSPRRQ